MIYRFITLCAALCYLGADTLYAQGELDVLRFSQYGTVGTARVLGMGGAFAAAGADLSSAHHNPAGLAMYRKSELNFTPSLKFINNTSSYLGSEVSDPASNFAIANMGFVFADILHYDEEGVIKPKGLQSWSVAFGYNQLANYYRNTTAAGYNEYSSITDMFASLASGTPYDQLNTNSIPWLAYEAYTIEPLLTSTDNDYFPAVNNGRIHQTLFQEERGRNNEWYGSLAGNFDDFLYVGATIGVQNIRYSQNFRFVEEDRESEHQNFQNDPSQGLEFPTEKIDYRNTFSTRGSGFNAKIGFTIRPSDELRIGLAIHSPTYFSLRDEYSYRIIHNHELNDPDIDSELDVSTDQSLYRYRLSTPYKVTLGGMYRIKKIGIITADVDLTDYTNANLSSFYDFDDPAYYDFLEENTRVDDFFKMAINYRMGGELRFGMLRLRGGAAFFGVPVEDFLNSYQDHIDPNTTLEINPFRRVLSFGIGVKKESYYLDATFVNQSMKDKINPYTLATDKFNPALVNRMNTNNVTISLGFYF